MVKHLSADELKEQYQRDLDVLQRVCPHKKTHWCEEWYAPAHGTGWMVLSCKNCRKILKRKANCYGCGKEILIDGDEFQKMKYDDFKKQGYCDIRCYSNFTNGITHKE